MTTDKPEKKKRFQWFRNLLILLRRYLITGIIVSAPIVVTLWALLGLFRIVDELPKRMPGNFLPDVPGVGVIIILSVIILIGIFATNVIGKRLISFGEKILGRIPLAKNIYNAVQQISTAFLGSQRSIFDKVVIVEYPRKGLYSLGFLTSEAEGEVQVKTDQKVVAVFIPTTPNPTSGLLIFVPKDELIYMDMTTEDGLKLVISGGVVEPPYKDQIEGRTQKLDNTG